MVTLLHLSPKRGLVWCKKEGDIHLFVAWYDEEGRAGVDKE